MPYFGKSNIDRRPGRVYSAHPGCSFIFLDMPSEEVEMAKQTVTERLKKKRIRIYPEGFPGISYDVAL